MYLFLIIIQNQKEISQKWGQISKGHFGPIPPPGGGGGEGRGILTGRTQTLLMGKQPFNITVEQFSHPVYQNMLELKYTTRFNQIGSNEAKHVLRTINY